MRTIIMVFVITTMVLTACSKGPYPASRAEICEFLGLDMPEGDLTIMCDNECNDRNICKALGLSYRCEEGVDYCFDKYLILTKEVLEWQTILVPSIPCQ